jgi:hypothetical protein
MVVSLKRDPRSGIAGAIHEALLVRVCSKTEKARASLRPGTRAI